jgi:chromosome segregation ATPase
MSTQSSTTNDDVMDAQALADAAHDQQIETNVAQVRVSPPQVNDAGETLVSLQNVIERNALELDRISEELRKVRESLKSVFENDSELSSAQEQAERVSTQLKQRKQQLQQGPQIQSFKTKISDLKEHKKEIEEALNSHLLSLYTLTHTQTVDLSTGEREFTVRASLKRKKTNE